MSRSILALAIVLALSAVAAVAQEPTAADHRAANRILAGKSPAEIDRLDLELERVLEGRAKVAMNKLADAISAERALKQNGPVSEAGRQEAANRVAAADAELQDAFTHCLRQFLAPKRLRVAAYIQWKRRQQAK